MDQSNPLDSEMMPVIPIRIFLSSPGDLFPVRIAVKQLIEGLNQDPRYENTYKFILYAYEDRVPPIVGEEPQLAVDKYTLRPDAADIFVCLFWKRLGTPTSGIIDPETAKPYASGTVYELLTAYRARRAREWPVILLYRCTAPAIDPIHQTTEQEQALEAFLARFYPEGDLIGLADATFNEFDARADDLVRQLHDDLVRVIEVELSQRIDKAVRQMRQPRAQILLLPPTLPDEYVERSEVIDDLRRLALGTKRRIGIVALHGQGGVGKTTLAQALCYDPATRSTFSDGVLWTTLGPSPNILQEQRRWIRALGGDETQAINTRDGTDELRRLLHDRAMLLVLDNVWQREAAEAFLVGGQLCHTVITTRNAETAQGARFLVLDVMNRDESKQLLQSASGNAMDDTMAEEIATRLGDLPLALDLVAGQLRLGTGWSTIKQALDKRHDLCYLGVEQGKVYAVIASSVDALPLSMAERFYELAIFPSGEPLDRDAGARLWLATAAVDRAESEHILLTLHARALLKPEDIIHDLICDYLQRRFPSTSDQLRNVQYHFIDSYGESVQWPVLPTEENYAWRRLVWHLMQAARRETAQWLVTHGRYLAQKIALLGTEAVAQDVELVADDSKDEPGERATGDSTHMHLLAACLRRSAHILDHDVSQLQNQLFGRLGEQSPLHDAPVYDVALSFIWPSLAPAGGMEVRILASDIIAVQSCAFSPDGRWLATTTGDESLRSGSVQLWDVARGSQVREFMGHDDSVLDCAFSPDGHTLATVSRDGTTRLWDVTSGTQLQSLTVVRDALWDDGDNGICRCTFSPDGYMLATIGDDWVIRLWDVASGAQIRELIHYGQHGGPVQSCAFSPDGQLLASRKLGGLTILWDVASGAELYSLTASNVDFLDYWPKDLGRCTFSPDGHLLATTGDDGTTRLWDVARRSEVRSFAPESLAPNFDTGEYEDFVMIGCAFSPDGRLLAATDGGGTTWLWDVASGNRIHALRGQNSWAQCCTFSPNGRLLATAEAFGTVLLWDVESGRQIRSFANDFDEWNVGMRGCAFSPDGRWLVTAGGTTVRLWDVVSGTEHSRVNVDAAARVFAVHPYDPIFAVGDATGRINLLRLKAVLKEGADQQPAPSCRS